MAGAGARAIINHKIGTAHYVFANVSILQPQWAEGA